MVVSNRSQYACELLWIFAFAGLERCGVQGRKRVVQTMKREFQFFGAALAFAKLLSWIFGE
jgi:hypothetical protein